MRTISTLLLKIMALSVALILVSCSSAPEIDEDDSSDEVPETTAPANMRDDTVMQFQFPLKEYKRMARGFKKKHKGIDLSADKNTPIYAAESGWVTYAGKKFKGFGRLVIIEHSKTWATFYAHLNTFSAQQGQWINKGELVGYVGRSGRSTGNHLHFEIRRNHVPIDPMVYFADQDVNVGSK